MNAARHWLAAARPQTLTASAAPVVVGTALALADGAFRPMAALMALLGAAFIQIGTNFFNDLSDFRKGADGDDRLGPPRAVAQGWLTERQVAWATVLAFLAAAAAGLVLVWIAGWPVVAIGVVSILCGLAYTGGPAPLAYVGLGDLFVMVFFGGVAVCGTYYVQADAVPAAALLASIPVGALATAILVVNNLRDRHSDARARKRTLVVRFGRTFALAEYDALVALAYLTPAAAVVSGVVTWGWLLPMASLPLALGCVRAVHTLDGAALNPILGQTARLGLVFSALLSVGVLL